MAEEAEEAGFTWQAVTNAASVTASPNSGSAWTCPHTQGPHLHSAWVKQAGAK